MPLALADELFLICLDLRSGKAQVGEAPLGIGLRAALLAELVLFSSLKISSSRIGLGAAGRPTDTLDAALFDEVSTQFLDLDPSRPDLSPPDPHVRDWLSAQHRLVVEQVGERLIASGELHRTQVRRFGRTRTRHLPVRPPETFLRTQRLPSYLRNHLELQEADVVLAGLVSLVPTARDVLELDSDSRRHLEELLSQVKPQLQELLTITQSMIAGGLRDQRR